jgi:hypothetical protein
MNIPEPLMVVAVAGSSFAATQPATPPQETQIPIRGQTCSGLKILLSASALLATLAIAPAAKAQVVINIGVPPVCSYGYYDYAPYSCAPVGFYGPGYFYNGIFLGMGPWAGWGYGHGWGDHRFSRSGGGRYTGGGGAAANRGGNRGAPAARGNYRAASSSHARPSATTSHAAPARAGRSQPAAHPAAAHSAHASPPRGGGPHGDGHK